ncbi:MAG TPA: fluoride efflux transporter CrcB [Gemmatimonadales bacterium]|nr:fluoride efflux transporter CrcB [Gemmatimonadales bacterium]
MIWYVALGSAVGGVLRYLLGGWVQERAGTSFPLQTLLINVTGSLLLGFVQRYALETTAISAEVRTLLTVGVCGGYTTFSTFSLETVRMLEDGDWRRAALYIGLSVALSVGAALLGIALARTVLEWRRA